MGFWDNFKKGADAGAQGFSKMLEEGGNLKAGADKVKEELLKHEKAEKDSKEKSR